MRYLSQTLSWIVLLFSLPLQAANAVSGSVELGAVGVHQHKIRFGKDGTRFDYRNDGNQDVLYPYQRFALNLWTDQGSSWQFIYNPLEFKTKTTLKKDTRIDGTDFAATTPLDLTYSFPFYRLSYCSAPCGKATGFFYGGGLQIRNASIIFEDPTTNTRIVKQNVGPVPLIKLGYAAAIANGMLLVETDSMYANIKVLNGSDNDVIGGFSDTHVSYFAGVGENQTVGLRLRYLGGGAQGTNEDDLGGSDGYTQNWIDLFAFSLVFEGRI